jgi:hemerythrin superfamily protein
MPRASEAKNEKGQDALALLMADHKKVKALFKEFEKIKEDEDADDQKAALAEQICNELTVHAQIEEEIFYPAARDAIEETDLLDEAEVEHASVKELISQLQEMTPEDALFDAKVTVLGEYVDHHVKEEEGEMFKKVRAADLDTEALGAELMDRKMELMDELGMDDEEGADEDVEQAPPAKPAAKKSTSGARKSR